MKYSISLDIGATKTLGGIVVGRKVLHKIKKPTQSNSGRAKIIKNIISIIEELQSLQLGKLQKIGIGIAGQVDIKKGIVLGTGNFSKDFKNIKLVDILTKKFGVPVQIDNDVKAFTKAEAKLGAGRGLKNIIGLTFGTGIGGGIFMNNKMWRGKDNTAGEVGHMKISGKWIGNIPKCGNNNEKYCWESVASGRAWHKLYKKYGKQKADKIIVYNITTGLLNLCDILNPDVIVLGGGLIEHGDILSKIKKEFNSRCPQAWLKKTRIVKARLSDEAILFGALM